MAVGFYNGQCTVTPLVTRFLNTGFLGHGGYNDESSGNSGLRMLPENNTSKYSRAQQQQASERGEQEGK